MAFFPLAAETFGGWHRVGEREIKKLGSALARHTGQEESEAVHDLLGRLEILLLRGNATFLGNMIKSESYHMYLIFSSNPMHCL